MALNLPQFYYQFEVRINSIKAAVFQQCGYRVDIPAADFDDHWSPNYDAINIILIESFTGLMMSLQLIRATLFLLLALLPRQLIRVMPMHHQQHLCADQLN